MLKRLLFLLLLPLSLLAQTQIGGGGSSTSQPASAGYDATLSGVIPNDGSVCFDGTSSISTATVTSAGQCTWTSADVNKLIFLTNVCTTGQCGYVNYVTSITSSPSTQLTVARIATINSAHSITLDCNSPANCSSPFANTATAGHGTIVYGHDQTTALNAAWVAALTQSNAACGLLNLPPGILLFSSSLFRGSLVPSTNACTSPQFDYLFTISQLTYPNIGFGIHGRGAAATVLTPLPSFNWASCGTDVNFVAIGGGNNALDLQDFSVLGFGQSLYLSGLGGSCNALISLSSGYMRNFHCEGWANETNATADGISFGGTGNNGYMVASDISSIACGGAGGGGTGAACHFTGASDKISNSVCIGAGPTSVKNDSTPLDSINMTYGPPGRINTPALINTATWQDVNSYCEGSGTQYGQTSPTNTFQNNSGAFLYLTNFANGCQQASAAGTGFSNASGAVADLDQYKAFGATWTTGVNNAGTFYDRGPNTYGGPITNTGVYFAPGGGCNGTAATSATTNFGTAIGSTNLLASTCVQAPLTLSVNIRQVTAGVGCGAGSNTATLSITYTAPGGTAETVTSTTIPVLTISANGAVDSGSAGSATTPTNVNFQFTPKVSTAIAYSVASSLGSAGCSTTPQYAVDLRIQ